MTLTEAAHWTKRFGIIFGGVFALFIIGVLIFVSVSSNRGVEDYLKPDFACTETKDEFLQNKLSIPSLELATGSDRVYELETETGKVDALPRIANVHKFNISGQSLNAQGEAKVIANKLGFNANLIQRQASEYVFSDARTHRTLTVYARDLNFKMTTNFTKFGAIDNTAPLPGESEAIGIATNYLKSKGLLFEDYLKSTPEAVNINLEPNGTFSQAKSRSEAELIRVDFYRKKPLISIRGDLVDAKRIKDSLEKKFIQSTTSSIVTEKGRVDIYNFDAIVAFENPNKPNISVYIGPKNQRFENSETSHQYIYQIDFTYWPVDPQACGTYTLISPQTALNMVQKGQGSLVYLNEKNGDDVIAYTPKKVGKFTIYTITLGYYEPSAEAKFMQPIYIISGEATLSTGVVGRFHYYVPAIDYNLVKNRVVNTEVPTDSPSLF